MEMTVFLVSESILSLIVYHWSDLSKKKKFIIGEQATIPLQNP